MFAMARPSLRTTTTATHSTTRNGAGDGDNRLFFFISSTDSRDGVLRLFFLGWLGFSGAFGSMTRQNGITQSPKYPSVVLFKCVYMCVVGLGLGWHGRWSAKKSIF
ncbi:hypothetical protein QBC36DRAFT_3979 [Triangularia setosa]|uniref:Uncharacterized protein n=1 Tax=Triangularia setosa TaxID=2587417 RepID=A0AAN7A8Y8_9PEZI|nr:hypothetical protein QBC36DRAFT_3979 [Podospora setosa]